MPNNVLVSQQYLSKLLSKTQVWSEALCTVRTYLFIFKRDYFNILLKEEGVEGISFYFTHWAAGITLKVPHMNELPLSLPLFPLPLSCSLSLCLGSRASPLLSITEEDMRALPPAAIMWSPVPPLSGGIIERKDLGQANGRDWEK